MRTLASSLVFGLAILACSSSDDAPADDGFDAFAQSYCGTLVGCCVPSGQRKAEECVAVLRGNHDEIGFDRVKGDACIEELRARPLLDTCKDTSARAPSCALALAPKSGPKKPGEPCAKRSDCAASPDGEVACVVEVGGPVCELTIVGKEGDGPCLGTLEKGVIYEAIQGTRPARAFTCDLGAGVYCNRTAQRCERIGDVGAPCERGTVRACVRAAYCDASGKCAPRVPVDGSCESADCVREATCDATKKCVALKSASALCMESAECASGYCNDGRCDELPAPQDPIFSDVCFAKGT